MEKSNNLLFEFLDFEVNGMYSFKQITESVNKSFVYSAGKHGYTCIHICHNDRDYIFIVADTQDDKDWRCILIK